MKHTKWITMGLSFLLMALLTGCVGLIFNGENPETRPSPTFTEEVLTQKTNTITPETAGESANSEATQTVEVTDAAPQDITPTAREGLQATDPETVMLASGEIQLVEFFAFW